MSNIPSSTPSTVPSIHIHDADGSSALFNGATDAFLGFCGFALEDTNPYPCSQGLHAPYPTSNIFRGSPAELEDIAELSHLITTPDEFLTGPDYSTILREGPMDGRLSPAAFGSPIPSPSSSFDSSLSPSSFYSLALSDIEYSPSSASSDRLFFAHESSNQNGDLGSFPNDSVPPNILPSQTGPHRARSRSFTRSRCEPVASKAMLEANGRRRRHPAQFSCPECEQTFTALFSLRRHAQSHTGQRPYACSIPGCGQRFYNSSDCKRHEKSRKRHKDLSIQ